MDLKYILILILALFLIVPNGFSPGTLTDEDTQWIENFDEMFEQNPLEGFSRNINRAWEFLQNSPQRLAEFGRDVISRAFQTSSDNFVDLVDSERSLLEDPDVREFYELAIVQDPSVAVERPETFSRFLEQEGIGGPGSSFNFELMSYSRGDGPMIIRRDDGSVVSIRKTALQGGSLNNDGSVTLRTGQQILDGTVVETPNNEFRVAISSPNRPARIINQGVEFTGTEMNLGVDSSTQNQFVRAVSDDITFQDFFGREAALTQNSRLSTNEQGDYGLQGRVEIYSLRNEGTPHEFIGLDAAYETDFPDGSNEEMRLTFRVEGCEGQSNCILEQTTQDGRTNMAIFVSGQGNPKVEVPASREVQVQVGLIEDSTTRLSLIQRGQEEGIKQFDITREGVEQIGFGGKDDGLTLWVSNSKQFHPGQEEEEFTMVYQNGELVRSNIVLTGEGGGVDLSVFSEGLREQIQNADFQSIPVGEQSIVDALSRLGLPTDLNFRRQLAEQLGIEDYRGTLQQNQDLIARLRGGEVQFGSTFFLAGEQFPEIFEFDPNFEGIVAQLEENAQGELELPTALQGANFDGVNFRDPSIVNILNEMGLDSSFAARQQLYRELFGRDPPTGDQGVQMNRDLRSALREIDAVGTVSTRGDATGQVSEPLTQQQIAQGQRITPRGQNFDGSVTIRNLPEGIRAFHPNGMIVNEAAARTLFGECRGCTDTEMRLLADVIRNRAYRHNGDFGRVLFTRWQFSPWNGFTVPGQSPDSNGLDSARTPMSSQQMQRALRIWEESAQGDTSNGATHFFNPRTSSPNWGSSLVSTVPQGVSTQHRIGYLTSGDPFRPAVVRARNE